MQFSTWKLMVLSVVVFVGNLPLVGCGSGDGTSTGPTGGAYNGVYDDVTFNDQSESQTSFCSVSHTTQFGLLRVHYDNNTSDTHSVYWNSGHASQSVNVLVSIGGLDQGYQSVMHAAVQIWSAELQDPALMKSANSYFSVLPSDQYDTAGSNVNAYMQAAPDPSAPFTIADFGFGLDSTGMRIQRASIVFYSSNESSNVDYRYAAALHEVGHILGLAHNPDLGSIMFHNADRPAELSGQACFQYNASNPTGYPGGSAPPAPHRDTDVLENYYDPIIKNDDGGGGGPICKGKVCYYSVFRSTLTPVRPPTFLDPNLPPLRRIDNAHGASVSLPQSWRPTYSGPPVVVRGFPVTRTSSKWIRGNEYGLALAGHSEDLILSSSLVAQGVVGPPTQSVLSAGDDLVVRPLRLTSLYRHLVGPDEGRKPGDVIFVVDSVPSDGGTYIDDPDLATGPSPILFLKRADSRLSKLFGRQLYAFTEHYVSKWGVDKTGHIKVLSARASRIGTEVNGQTAASIAERATKKYGARVLDERSLVTAMLGGHGVRSIEGVKRYREDLSSVEGSLMFDSLARRSLSQEGH